MITQRFTYARAIQLRDQLREAIAVQHANKKGADYLERDLVKVTTWLVAYEARQERKQKAAA